MNNVCLIGRLVRDPETRYAQGDQGTAIVRYTLAVDRAVKREGQPAADFIQCVAFGRAGEFAGKYYHKGLRVGVVGRIQTDSYKNRDGRTVYTTDVIVATQYFADGRQDQPAASQEHAQTPAPQPAPQAQPKQTQMDFEPYEDEEDIPF